MPLTRQEVADRIRKAFNGVTLGGGVGLLEGQALDDYADEATRKAVRERDEKDNWECIPVETLNSCESSLCFFDAEGMRFHLPAFLIVVLAGEERGIISPVPALTRLDDFAMSKLVALSKEQREAVREFLLFIRDAPDYDFDRPYIERALSNYWTSDAKLHKN